MLMKVISGFLVLPGTVAILIPLLISRYDPWRKRPSMPLGVFAVVLGAFVLIWCVRDFYVAGDGTLTPWEPPKKLVVVGLYRFVRNPMYIGVLIMLFGWAVFYGSPMVAVYLLMITVAFHLRIVKYEEPRLKEQYGDAWATYRQNVPRWLPK